MMKSQDSRMVFRLRLRMTQHRIGNPEAISRVRSGGWLSWFWSAAATHVPPPFSDAKE